MKIVWVSHSQKLGGAERSLCDAAQGLVSHGHDVTVVLPSRGELAEVLEGVGAQTFIVPHAWWVHMGEQPISLFRRLRKVLTHLRSCGRLRRFLKCNRPDIVVTNTIAAPSGALVAKSLRLPHIWYIHEFGQEDHNLKFDFGKPISILLINFLSDRIIVNSQVVLNKFSECLPVSKMRLVYYAVETKFDTTKAEKYNNGTLHVTLMGQIAPGKRQVDAVEAVSLLNKKKVDVRLTLIGSEHNPSYSASLRQMVSDLGVEKYVNFVPFTNDPLSCLAASDVVLMCSSNEAFGRVTVEAMKLGKPVIGANSGGTTELIEHGVTGLLYDSGSVSDLAEKLEVFYNDRNLMKVIGCTAQKWAVETFNSKKYTSSLEKVFKELL